MAITGTRVVCFGDQTEGSIAVLPDFLQAEDNPLILSFLERACHVLRSEIRRAPYLPQALSSFISIKDLARKYTESGFHRAELENTLLLIYHVASFLRWSDRNFEPFPQKGDAVLVGSCTGLLAACAISCSRSCHELVSVALEVIRIAYRIGSRVSSTQEDLAPNTDWSWSVLIPAISVKDCTRYIEDYCQAAHLASLSRPYISAVSSSSVTISAPPRVLDDLLHSKHWVSSPPRWLPVYGPYHAPHLYEIDPLRDTIVESLPEEATSTWTVQCPVVSGDGRTIYAATTLRELMIEISTDVLHNVLDWSAVTQNCMASVRRIGSSSCRLIPIASSHIAASLATSLRALGDTKIESVEDLQPRVNHARRVASFNLSERSKVAIVGMSGRFPGAANCRAFWELLRQGLDVHEEIPPTRFDVATHYDPNGKKRNTSHTPFGCFIDSPGLFDARFFDMSPREARQTDPMHRLALSTAYEAMEMAGLVPNRTASTMGDRIGTFYGQTSDDWREIQNGQDIQTHFIPGGVRAFAPGRINYHFKFSGPSFSVDTACSSSLAAINIACNSLWQRDCDTAIAGGLNVLTNPDIFSGLSRGQFLSKTGNCKTFDDNADGYCRGDGAGTVILKRLEDAEADGDPILAVILGVGTNHSADAVSITHPHSGAQSDLFDKVMEDTKVDAHEVSYVEMHGTGTQAGDATEMQSVLSSFAPETRRRRPDQPLHLGSVKANVGHGEAASGITALIKVLLMYEHSSIPPHCGIKDRINRSFPSLLSRNVRIAIGDTVPWIRPAGGKRIACLNNFSAAGGNTSLLLEDGPLIASVEKSQDGGVFVPVVISAKTTTALSRNIDNLIQYLRQNPDTDLSHLSYTTTARRKHYPFRVAVVGSNIEAIGAELENHKGLNHSRMPSRPAVTFAFTGQGSHYSGMGKELKDRFPTFGDSLSRFDLLARNNGFGGFLAVIDGEVAIENHRPTTVQLAAVCLQMALVRLWRSWGVEPAAVIGHSLGEYPALFAAGVLSANDVIYLVGTRAQLLEARCTRNTHAMLAVSASREDLNSEMHSGTVEIACLNGPNAVVLSGPAAEIHDLLTRLTRRGISCRSLALPYAFHSAQVDPILKDFQTAASGVTFNSPTIPFVSTLLGRELTVDDKVDATYLVDQCRLPVDFAAGLQSARASGLLADNTVFIDIGSQPLCSTMIRCTLGDSFAVLPCLRHNEPTSKTLSRSLSLAYLAGLDVDWDRYHRQSTASQRCLQLPSYAWDDADYWIDYENDWCLSKGKRPSPTNSAAPTTSGHTISSSVQRIIKQDSLNGVTAMTTETDILHPDLQDTMMGHLVMGQALCSSSVYAEMAFSIADYLFRQLASSTRKVTMDCANMVVHKPLIADHVHNASQLLRTTAKVETSLESCDLSFFSVDEQGNMTVLHAECKIIYSDAGQVSSQLRCQEHLIQSRLDALKQEADNSGLDRVRRRVAYRLFSVLVDYRDPYKGMSEVTWDDTKHEALARVELQTSNRMGSFVIPPYHIDSLCHLAGFVLNVSDEAGATDAVFVNHGWESLVFTEQLDPNTPYWSYVRMLPATTRDSTILVGNVYISNHQKKLIGLIGGIEFRRIPRQTLYKVLSAHSNVLPPALADQKDHRYLPSPREAVASTTHCRPSIKTKHQSLSTRAANIIANELGVDQDELSDTDELTALGMDSLMSLNIFARFREELGLHIPINMFTDCETMGEIQTFVAQQDVSYPEPSPPSSLPSTTSEGIFAPDIIYTPDYTDVSLSDDAGRRRSALRPMSKKRRILGVEVSKTSRTNPNALLQDPQCEEDEPDTSTDIDTDCETSGKRQNNLSPRNVSRGIASPILQSRNAQDHRPPFHTNTCPRATSVILQGCPRSAPQTLFLFPDGSGIASSYTLLPPLAPHALAIVGLNSPFLKQPEAFDCGIEGLTALFLAEVRRRQPHGPYVLGGWSGGGICAYEAVHQLRRAGEHVAELVLLDVPCPVPPQALPLRLLDFFDRLGLLGDGSGARVRPRWVVPHFKAVIRAMGKYWAPRLGRDGEGEVSGQIGAFPRTSYIWAADGVCRGDDGLRPEIRADDPPHMSWLLFDRPEDGSIGWEDLLGGRENVIFLPPVPGVNHFTMMREPGVNIVGDRLRTALGIGQDQCPDPIL